MPRVVSHQGRIDFPWSLGERWRDHHVPVVNRTATVPYAIYNPDTPGAVDQTTHKRTRTPGAQVWPVPAGSTGLGRLQQTGDAQTTEVGGQQVTTRQYELSIEWGYTDLRTGLVVRFPGATDPQLAEKDLTVVEYHLGSLRWSTVLICEANDG